MRLPPVRSVGGPTSGRVFSNREGVSAVIMQDALPDIKRFLKPLGLSERSLGLTIRCVAAFILHWGRMSAVQAAGAVRSEPRHRAQICRFLGRKYWYKMRLIAILQAELLAREVKKG